MSSFLLRLSKHSIVPFDEKAASGGITAVDYICGFCENYLESENLAHSNGEGTSCDPGWVYRVVYCNCLTCGRATSYNNYKAVRQVMFGFIQDRRDFVCNIHWGDGKICSDNRDIRHLRDLVE